MDCFHLLGTLFWTGCVTDLELPTTTLESLMTRPVRIRLETNGKNRKQKPVKLPSKTMHICFSRLKSSSLHYSQYTLPSNESKKKLRTSKPIFCCKTFWHPLLYHIPEYALPASLRNWILGISLLLPFKRPYDKPPWNLFPLNFKPSHLLLLASTLSFTYILGRRISRHANKRPEKNAPRSSQVSQYDFQHQSLAASLLILQCCLWVKVETKGTDVHEAADQLRGISSLFSF